MKEIRFRAWDKTNRKMLPVNDIHWIEGNARYNIDFITVWDDEINTGYTLDTHDHDFELMQFTGLKDKNGKEIYEGDLLHGHPYIDICKVFYDEQLCSYRCEEIGGMKASSHLLDWSGEADLGYNPLTVIGNIYENPILEVK